MIYPQSKVTSNFSLEIWDIDSISGYHTHPAGLSVIQAIHSELDFIPLSGPYVTDGLQEAVVHFLISDLQLQLEQLQQKCVMWGSLCEKPSRSSMSLIFSGVDHEWSPNWGLRSSLLLDHFSDQKKLLRKNLLREWQKAPCNTLLHVGGWLFCYSRSSTRGKCQFNTLFPSAKLINPYSPNPWPPVGTNALSKIGTSVIQII